MTASSAIECFGLLVRARTHCSWADESGETENQAADSGPTLAARRFGQVLGRGGRHTEVLCAGFPGQVDGDLELAEERIAQRTGPGSAVAIVPLDDGNGG